MYLPIIFNAQWVPLSLWLWWWVIVQINKISLVCLGGGAWPEFQTNNQTVESTDCYYADLDWYQIILIELLMQTSNNRPCPFFPLLLCLVFFTLFLSLVYIHLFKVACYEDEYHTRLRVLFHAQSKGGVLRLWEDFRSLFEWISVMCREVQIFYFSS